MLHDGRHEPGTGELTYENILRPLAYDGSAGFAIAPQAGTDEALTRIVELRARPRSHGYPVS